MMGVSRPRASGLLRSPDVSRVPLAVHGFHGCIVTVFGASPPRRCFCLPRQGLVRCRGFALTLKGMFDCTRPFGRWFALRGRAMSASKGLLGVFSRPLTCFALLGWRQIDSGPPGLRQANGDGLLRRSCPVFSLADMVDFLADELARLRAGRFSLALVPACPLNRLLLWHDSILSRYWRAGLPLAGIKT